MSEVREGIYLIMDDCESLLIRIFEHGYEESEGEVCVLCI